METTEKFHKSAYFPGIGRLLQKVRLEVFDDYGPFVEIAPKECEILLE